MSEVKNNTQGPAGSEEGNTQGTSSSKKVLSQEELDGMKNADIIKFLKDEHEVVVPKSTKKADIIAGALKLFAGDLKVFETRFVAKKTEPVKTSDGPIRYNPKKREKKVACFGKMPAKGHAVCRACIFAPDCKKQ